MNVPRLAGGMVTWTAEALMATATSIVLMGPTAVLWMSFARVGTRRLLFAALAFSSFLATEFAVLADQWRAPTTSSATEVIELVGDIMTACLFAAAFLWPVPRGE
ncbi:MAG: hypothetical protein ACYDBQ_02545 [Thermoplasmatota archaeon]